MAITDDLRKTLTDPTPLYFAAGTADIAVQQARKVPALIEKFQTEAPARIDAVRNTDPRTVQDRVATQAKEAQASVSAKFTEVIGTFDTDLKKLGETAQDLALRSIGMAAEYAVRARETYEKVAERGEQSVRQWRGEAADDLVLFGTVTESKAPAGPKAGSRTEPKAESKAGPKAEARIAQPRTAPKPGPKPAPKTVKSEAKPVAKPAAAKKTSTTPRKATAKKTTPPAGK